jgi:hypothetical protein
MYHSKEIFKLIYWGYNQKEENHETFIYLRYLN